MEAHAKGDSENKGKVRSGRMFAKRLEFNVGDVSLANLIQVPEPASRFRSTVDAIRRFGGSTSPATLWPGERFGGFIAALTS